MTGVFVTLDRLQVVLDYVLQRSQRMSLTNLPKDLPPPIDRGEADHLSDSAFPDTKFNSTRGGAIDLCGMAEVVVLYVYPMTGRPDIDLPEDWDIIPGARGCTPQSCSFRDHYAELQSLSAEVFGLSVQSTEYQLEAVSRLHLPFPLLSDEGLVLKKLLKLPTFMADGMELYRRITLIIQNRKISKVFYPVFPPDQNANDVLTWLQNQKS